MSRGLNKIMLIGNLGRDPEMRFTPSGKAVTTFSLAASRSWKNSDGDRKQETEWFNIVAYGSLAEICNEHLQKGRRVYIEGRIKTRKWQAEDGTRHSKMEVITQELIFLSDKQNKSSQDDTEESFSQDDIAEEEDEFPF